MKIETKTEIEHHTAKDARILIHVIVDGKFAHRFVHASGPKDIIQDYFDGVISHDELETKLFGRPQTPRASWVIEFRSGTYFQNLESERGGPKQTAKQFDSEAEANTFMRKNTWILGNGGMAVPMP